jgi:hypothetical protein
VSQSVHERHVAALSRHTRRASVPGVDGERYVVARLIQYETPDWQPLLRVAGEELTFTFMWMHEVGTPAGQRLHAYKHIDTRRYVHLDREGNAFVYVGEHRYRKIDLALALEPALRTWEHLGASPRELAAGRVAIERAGRAARCRVPEGKRR